LDARESAVQTAVNLTSIAIPSFVYLVIMRKGERLHEYMNLKNWLVTPVGELSSSLSEWRSKV